MSIVAVAHDKKCRVFGAARQPLHERPATIEDRRALHGGQSKLHGLDAQAVCLARVALHQPRLDQAAGQPICRGAVQAGGLRQRVELHAGGVMPGDLL
ncbi:hypothetical protein D3C72_1998140 [compost metagenome]